MKFERISSKHSLYLWVVRVIDEFNLLLYFFLCHLKLSPTLPHGKHELLLNLKKNSPFPFLFNIAKEPYNTSVVSQLVFLWGGEYNVC